MLIVLNDKQVTEVRRHQPGGRLLVGNRCLDYEGKEILALVPLPDFICQRADNRAIEAWSVFINLVGSLKKRLRGELRQLGQGFPNREIVFFMRCQNEHCQFEVAQSWAENLLGLPALITDSSPWEVFVRVQGMIQR